MCSDGYAEINKTFFLMLRILEAFQVVGKRLTCLARCLLHPISGHPKHGLQAPRSCAASITQM